MTPFRWTVFRTPEPLHRQPDAKPDVARYQRAHFKALGGLSHPDPGPLGDQAGQRGVVLARTSRFGCRRFDALDFANFSDFVCVC